MGARYTGGRKGLGRSLAALVLALLLIAGLSAPGFADLRIVHKADEERTDVLVKNGRIAWNLDDEDWTMIDCDREEVTFVAPPRYWRGPVTELAATLQALREELLQDLSSGPGLESLFGSMAGSRPSGTTQVRVTRGHDDDNIAGYRATQYRVETGDGSQWKTYELIWISRDLMREIEGEVGRCTHILMDITQEFTALVPLGDTPVVYGDPSYRALYEQGFPMRSVTKMTVFGIELDIESEVVEVSRAPLDESLFTVPSNYQRADNLADLLVD